MVGQKVCARIWNQSTQPFEEGLGCEDDVGLAVGVGMMKPIEDASTFVEREAFDRERGACDVTAELFELSASIGGNGGGCVQGEAGASCEELGRFALGRMRSLVGRVELGCEKAFDSLALIGSRGFAAMDRGVGEVQE